MRRAALTLAFLCILALAYLAWAQQQDIRCGAEVWFSFADQKEKSA